MANLNKGDRVVTTGGICGTVVEIGDETVTLKVDANTRITFTKEAIAHYQPNYKILYNCALNPLGALLERSYGELAKKPIHKGAYGQDDRGGL